MANIRAHSRLLDKKTKLMTVVKSNAYGHGLELVSRLCERSGLVDMLGTASLNEALQIRAAGVKLPILVLSYYRPFDSNFINRALCQNISFMAYENQQLKILERAARAIGKQAHVHLKLDTGMARLGLSSVLAEDMFKYISKSAYLRLDGIASHLATAESADKTFLHNQVEHFNDFILRHDNDGASLTPHIACTAAITNSPEAHFGLVRLGIGLYGLWPSLDNRTAVEAKYKSLKLQPALTWKTQVVEVQELVTGMSVGYDRTFVTKRPSVMAVLPVGYWDGYDRALSNIGEVIIHGTRSPIIGRICMNICMVDVTDIPEVKTGDEVVLIGTQKYGSHKSEISAEEIAGKIGTINYEVVTRINPLLPRILT